MEDNSSINDRWRFELSKQIEEITLPEPARIVLLPAAGESRRMGRHKLSLPFGSHSLIQQVIHQYLEASVDLVVIVRQPEDGLILDAIIESEKVLIVTPSTPPAEMKTSLQFGMAAVRSIRELHEQDIFLLSPPDMPLLTPKVIRQLLDYWTEQNDFLSPVYEQRKGHPLLFSPRVAAHINEIPDDQGFNWLEKSDSFDFKKNELQVNEPGILFDVDTPEAYQVALQRAGLTD